MRKTLTILFSIILTLAITTEIIYASISGSITEKQIKESIKNNLLTGFIYDDNGNMINKPDVILKKGVLGEYTIADIDKIFTDKVLDTSKLSGLMSNIQYAIPNVSIPNINLPEIQRNTGGVHNHYDNIELILPNITDTSTGAQLAKSFVNELKNLPSYAKQYDWNK